MTTADTLRDVHERLAAFYDLDRWHWRDDTKPYDICLGSILVQHTAWTNVEHALDSLRAAGIDSIEKLAALPDDELAVLVRPSGTPTVKARRLHAFAELVLSYGGFGGLFALAPDELRRVLLATPGIGPETADVIMLYAARLPAVVHDAYTARLMRRLGLGPDGPDRYDTWRNWLDAQLPPDAAYRRKHHAAIVVHCKELCRVKPRCAPCPLIDVCKYAQNGKEIPQVPHTT
jgi:endonuclease-3 related protein